MRRFPLMIFAAGLGTRMGPLTADRPKPLIPVAGRALIDHALDHAAGAGRVVVNTHYRAEMLAAHLAQRDVTLSHEPDILETGGGLKAALPMLGPGPVMTLNSDAVWTGENPLTQLAGAWDDRMEALLLLLPADQATGFCGTGDFLIDGEGRLSRANGAAGVAYLGAQILRTEALAKIADRKFSLNRVWDGMIARGGAHGLIHRGGWCDVGRPETIVRAEALLAGRDV